MPLDRGLVGTPLWRSKLSPPSQGIWWCALLAKLPWSSPREGPVDQPPMDLFRHLLGANNPPCAERSFFSSLACSNVFEADSSTSSRTPGICTSSWSSVRAGICSTAWRTWRTCRSVWIGSGSPSWGRAGLRFWSSPRLHVPHMKKGEVDPPQEFRLMEFLFTYIYIYMYTKTG